MDNQFLVEYSVDSNLYRESVRVLLKQEEDDYIVGHALNRPYVLAVRVEMSNDMVEMLKKWRNKRYTESHDLESIKKIK
jgi:hypothetical protein